MWSLRLTGKTASSRLACAAAWCVVISVFAGPAFAERVARPRQRAAPPTRWDKGTSGAFLDDAFATLQGQRPSFAARSSGAGAAPAVGGPVAQQPAAGGFKWSTLVSESTLTDEIKDMKAEIAAVGGKPSDFKGGGYDKAREGFSAIAVAFGVIAAYDQDVRWKKDAETARDLFARVGFNCKVGTDASLAETKLRLADLDKMLEGGSPDGKADRDGDFTWNMAAGRPALMTRLETADAGISAGIAAKGEFDKQLDRILHDAEMVAVIGHVIQQPDFEYHDDDSYKGYASAMRDAAVRVRDACLKKDYDAARAAAGELKKSCDSCHGEYR
jgi:hypothetical protein